MYERGERVVVKGFSERPTVLTVWEDRGRGLTLTTDDGYRRLLDGDTDAPQVGFPRGDVVGKAEPQDLVRD